MRGFRRSKKYEDMVRQLAEKPHSIAGRSIFPTMRELMCFAAVLGFEFDKRKPLDSDTNEIDSRIFLNSEVALDLLYLIGLATEKSVDILREENEEEMIRIFEEYAEGGFEILETWLLEKPEDTNGDNAILTALFKNGFLDIPRPIETAAPEINF